MLETALHPTELVRLLDHFDKHVHRVALFVGQQLVETGDPDDQINLEDLYDLWRKWRHKFVMPEAAFRTHLRALRLDICDDILVGYVPIGTMKPPPKTQRTMADFPMARLDKVLHLCATVQGVAEALGWPYTTLRDWMVRYPELSAKITKGLDAANAARGFKLPPTAAPTASTRRKRGTVDNNYGFDTYADYSAALSAKREYIHAKKYNSPDCAELYVIWQEAEAKKKKGPRT